MAEETITFELIRKIQLDEQKQPKLTKLPENFFAAVNSYIQQKRQLTLKDDRKVAVELKSTERLVDDIFSRRERKIVNSAITAARTKIQPENLVEEEKIFFANLVEDIKKRREESLQKILKQEKELATLLVFKDEVPEFVGSDEKVYGPFKKGDIAKLPEDNMKILVERGIAEEFKVPK